MQIETVDPFIRPLPSMVSIDGALLISGDQGSMVFLQKRIFNELYKYNSSYFWYRSSPLGIDPGDRIHPLLVRVGPKQVFKYGGKCTKKACVSGNWLFDLSLSDRRWRGDVTFAGDSPPPSDIEYALAAPIGGRAGMFLVVGGSDAGGAVKDAWVGEMTMGNVGEPQPPLITWTKIKRGVWPTKLKGASMVEMASGCAVLFGGDSFSPSALESNRRSYTVCYDENQRQLRWKRIASFPVSGGMPFTFSNFNFGMTSVNGQPILFSGSANQQLQLGQKYTFGNGQLWSFDGSQWVQLKSNMDQTRFGFNRRYFFFGQVDGNLVISSGYVPFALQVKDTWIGHFDENAQEWTFEDHTLRAGPAPQPLKAAGMHGYKNLAVMFGGNFLPENSKFPVISNDVWVFDTVSKEWGVVNIPNGEKQPSPRGWVSLAPVNHPNLGDFLLTFGGFNGKEVGGTMCDTWLLSMRDFSWMQWQEQPRASSLQPPCLNSYAMSPINDGVLLFSGLLSDEEGMGVNMKQFFFTCGSYGRFASWTDDIDEDCAWYELSSTLKVPNLLENRIEKSVRVASNVVITFPGMGDSCTWAFFMPPLSESKLPVESPKGEWQCIGRAGMMTTPESNPSIFSKGKYETAIAILWTGKNTDVHYFVLGADKHSMYNDSRWVTLADDSLTCTETSRRRMFAQATVESESTTTSLVYVGGQINGYHSSRLTDLGFTRSVQCPPGYVANIALKQCVECQVGTYHDIDEDRCLTCPGNTWTVGSASQTEESCTKCSPNTCFPDGTKRALVKDRWCWCECNTNFRGVQCRDKKNCFLGTDLLDDNYEGPHCTMKQRAKNTFTIVAVVTASLLLIACCFFCRSIDAKQQLYVQMGELDLTTKLLEETTLNIMDRDEELRDFREGMTIRFEDLTFIEKVGEGTYANVFRGKWTVLSTIDVAIKSMKKTEKQKKSGNILTQNETKILQRLRHPNLVLLFGVGSNPSTDEQFIVTEFVSGGELGKQLAKEQQKGIPPFPVSRRLVYMRDICSGMAFLHKKNILHRDLKSANVLVTDLGHCKVTDFGISRSMKTSRDLVEDKSSSTRASTLLMTSFAGSVAWMAPEMYDGAKSIYNQSIDVFSFGMLMYEIVTSKLPWELNEKAKRIVDVMHFVESGMRPVVPEGNNGAPTYFVTMMERCWDSDSKSRPSFEELVEFFDAKLATPSHGHSSGISRIESQVGESGGSASRTL